MGQGQYRPEDVDWSRVPPPLRPQRAGITRDAILAAADPDPISAPLARAAGIGRGQSALADAITGAAESVVPGVTTRGSAAIHDRIAEVRDATFDGLLGLVFGGLLGEETKANLAGQLLAAGVPVLGGLKALKGLKAVKGVTASAPALDMSTAARTARAAEQGFDTSERLYHGSNKAFQSFEPKPTYRRIDNRVEEVTPQAHFFTPDRDTAQRFADQRVRVAGELLNEKPGRATVREFFLRTENPLDLTVSPAIRKQMTKDGYSPIYNPDGINPYGGKVLEEILGGPVDDWNDVSIVLDRPDVIDELRQRGYDGVRMREAYDNAEAFAVFAPNQIRSTKARFDPTKRDSANIMATGLAAAGAGALAELQARQRSQPRGQYRLQDVDPAAPSVSGARPR
jgi:hypothetical protein